MRRRTHKSLREEKHFRPGRGAANASVLRGPTHASSRKRRKDSGARRAQGQGGEVWDEAVERPEPERAGRRDEGM